MSLGKHGQNWADLLAKCMQPGGMWREERGHVTSFFSLMHRFQADSGDRYLDRNRLLV